jgi:prepilin-type N-terminal cleavage/methylation domain-containing protein
MLGNVAGTTLAFAPRMQPTHARGRRRRRTRRGFSLVEIVVAVAIIAMISAGVTVAVVGINNQQKIKLTRSNAELLRGAVKMWRIQDNDSAACPTIPMLIADGQIDRGRMTKEDAWGQPWRIVCDERDATVTSLGPDRLPDTEDDIRVPPS